MNQKIRLIIPIAVVLLFGLLFLLLTPRANLLNATPLPNETAVSQTTTITLIGNPPPKPIIQSQIAEITNRLASDYILRLEQGTTIFPLPNGTDMSSETEQYYDFAAGPVHFFMLDSQLEAPEHPLATSTQAQWLKNQLAKSKAPWKIVYVATPPFSSGEQGTAPHLQWPYEAWGADAVISEGATHYERVHDGITYIVNGLASENLDPVHTPSLSSNF
ncbi:MAG: hypothetical protein AAF614_39990, partial [Chloroflexota bacterium]